MAIYHKTLQYHEGEKQPGLPEWIYAMNGTTIATKEGTV